MSLSLHRPLMLQHISRKRRLPSALPQGALFYDHFTGTNDATLAARVPPVSANGNGWTVPQGAFVTNNGRAEARFGAASTGLISIVTGFSDADIRVRFWFPSVHNAGTARVAGIMFRRVDNQNYWSTVANMDVGEYRILEITANVSTVRATGVFTFVADTPYDMRLVLVGNRMFSTLDGAGTISYESAVRNTETRHGLRAQNTIGDPAISFDNFIILPPPPPADVYITVAPTTLITSAYETSVVHTENDEILFGNATARDRALANVGPAVKHHHSYLISGGVADVWPLANPSAWTPGAEPVPAEPSNWGSLDYQLSRIIAMGGTPALTTHLYEWWMKGVVNSSGVTTPATISDQFSETGRPMTQYMPHEKLRIRRMCERYMVAPYSVRNFVLGIELHGWFEDSISGAPNAGSDYAWHDHEGTPGLHADMGYAFYHNEIGELIHAVAVELGISLNEIVIINNYPRMNHRAVPNSDSVAEGHPLRGTVWGTADKRPLRALSEGLPLINPIYLQAIGYDMGMQNDDSAATDDITNLRKLYDYPVHIRDDILVPLGLDDLPLVQREMYLRPQGADVEVDNLEFGAMLAAEGQRLLVEAGVWQGSFWGFRGRSTNSGPGTTERSAMVTSIATASGGQRLPVLDVIQLFHDHFSAGTVIRDVTISGTGVSVIASDAVVLLINQTADEQVVSVDNVIATMTGYQVLGVDR